MKEHSAGNAAVRPATRELGKAAPLSRPAVREIDSADPAHGERFQRNEIISKIHSVAFGMHSGRRRQCAERVDLTEWCMALYRRGRMDYMNLVGCDSPAATSEAESLE